jgi:hypothetical protein
MIWLILAGFAGVAAVGVSAWARGERKKVDAEGEARRARSQLEAEETRLLAKLRSQRGDGEGDA